jgi:hypothetical protein
MIEPVSREGFVSAQNRVLEAMREGHWHTLENLAIDCGIKYPSSVASRIRDLASNADSDRADHSKAWLYEKKLVPHCTRTYMYRLYPAPHSLQLELAVNA